MVDDAIRARAEDHTLLVAATLVATKASEAEAFIAKIAALDLRVQAYGAAAIHYAGQKQVDDVVLLAEKARKTAEVAPRTVRTVKGLCDAAIARQLVADKNAVSALTDLLFVFDRLSDDVEPPSAVTPEAIGHLKPTEATAIKLPSLEKLPLKKAFAALARKEPLGVRPVASALATVERRIDALVAAGTALADEGRRHQTKTPRPDDETPSEPLAPPTGAPAIATKAEPLAQ
jgi:hypothetical protein